METLASRFASVSETAKYAQEVLLMDCYFFFSIPSLTVITLSSSSVWSTMLLIRSSGTLANVLAIEC